MNEFPLRSRQVQSTVGVPRQGLNSQAGDAPMLSLDSRCWSPWSAGTRLLETPYCTIDWDLRHSLARFVRTELPYEGIADIESDGIEVQRVLEKAGRIRLLIDLRAITPRNDPSFEVAIASFRRKLLGGGQQVAILVRTAVGALQVKRHMREDGFQVEVFTQEEEALAFLGGRVGQVHAAGGAPAPARRTLPPGATLPRSSPPAPLTPHLGLSRLTGSLS